MKHCCTYAFILMFTISFCFVNCQTKDEPQPDPGTSEDFYFGGDLSYVNQILDQGGVYKDGSEVASPYKIFKERGGNLVRLRLWHTPEWTKEVYDPEGTEMYNDLKDVEKSIRLSREQGMKVLLDLHYSDNWADPGKQEIPEAWKNIQDVSILKDSVYNYTLKTLSYLESKGLMPDLIQIGNETNCGMLYTNAPAGFPSCNVCSAGQWQRLGEVINSAIKAVREVTATSSVKSQILLHVADPKNVEWWFDNILAQEAVIDFDIIGFSYYPLWHRTVSVASLSESVSRFKTRYVRPVMVLETAYPWTTAHHDQYNNHFGNETPLAGYPFSVQGQTDLLIDLTQEIIDGGGSGIIYWEPAWISIPTLKDQWGTGSAWESNTLFDFEGSAIQSIDYMSHDYLKK
ncbi:MAG: glycosyl hydrolase 53 family protein [Cyclobacteriaceae bacterium]